jgi:hypothetical protein
MPRSKNDPLKRKMAQALNHLSNAIVDVHEVYEAVDQSITRMTDADVENSTSQNAEAIERYKNYKETLKQVMMYTAVPREEIIKMVDQWWGLDEESIKVYLG